MNPNEKIKCDLAEVFRQMIRLVKTAKANSQKLKLPPPPKEINIWLNLPPPPKETNIVI